MTRRLLLAAAILAAWAGRGEAALALRFDNATEYGNIGNYSAGFSFTTNAAVDVVSLAYVLPGSSGSAVRLYDGSGTTLASALVLPTDPTEVIGGFTYSVHAIPSLTLSAGRTYYVAADLPDGHNNLPTMAQRVTTDPAITYGTGVLQNGLSGNPRSDTQSGTLNPAYFLPNLGLAPTAAVPEPSSMALAGLAALTGAGFGWRRRGAARRRA